MAQKREAFSVGGARANHEVRQSVPVDVAGRTEAEAEQGLRVAGEQHPGVGRIVEVDDAVPKIGAGAEDEIGAAGVAAIGGGPVAVIADQHVIESVAIGVPDAFQRDAESDDAARDIHIGDTTPAICGIGVTDGVLVKRRIWKGSVNARLAIHDPDFVEGRIPDQNILASVAVDVAGAGNGSASRESAGRAFKESDSECVILQDAAAGRPGAVAVDEVGPFAGDDSKVVITVGIHITQAGYRVAGGAAVETLAG